jgi:gliding motility-associated-like protein
MVAGTYIDTFHTALGCDSVVATTLVVNPKPSPDLGRDKNLCSNTSLSLTPGSFESYQWQDMSNANTYVTGIPGKYWVTVTNHFGCATTDTINIASVSAPPSNFLKPTDSICNGANLNVSAIRNFSSYQWSTGERGHVAQLQAPGLYWLEVIDDNGCAGRDTISIFQKQCLSGIFFPNAFTPNGSGKNDIFKPIISRKLTQYYFAIYNRWGGRVFETSDPSKGWNGAMNAPSQVSGLFVWTCSYQFEGAQPHVERGTVMVIR